MPAPLTVFVATIEGAFLLGGLLLLGRLALNPAARKPPGVPALRPWEVSGSDFLLFICLAISGPFVVGLLTSTLAVAWGLTGVAAKILPGAGAQFGLLLGVALFHFGVGQKLDLRAPGKASALVSGLATFLISLPVLAATSVIWRALLKAAGLPTESQDLVGMFATVDSPLVLAAMLTLAVLVAPFAEELVFRAVIFRYGRTRLPRAAALLLPAMVFALLHGNYASFGPLVVLAVILSLAYERTGHIGTTIVAHALFNLNTIMILFSGLDQLG